MFTYLALLVFIVAACYLGSIALLYSGLVAFIITSAFAVYAVVFLIFSIYIEPDSGFHLFNSLKFISVTVPTAVLAYANWRVKSGGIHNARVYGLIFSVVIAINLLETLIVIYGDMSVHNIIYMVLIISLCVSIFTLRWEGYAEAIGFNNKLWTISFGFTLSYLYLFIFLPGPGLFAFAILMIAYVPASRVGPMWFVFRGYSLWIYFIFYFIIGFRPAVLDISKEMEQLIELMRLSVLNEAMLGAGVVAASLLWYKIIRGRFSTAFKLAP